MITAIQIENFKGIGDPVRIDLKPITLLFGPNSAGKSTILHALHYAREIFERRNLDADQTIGGGRFVDLGGFRNFVHNRAIENTIHLGFDVVFSGTPLPGSWDPELDGNFTDPEFVTLGGRVHSAEIGVGIKWSELAARPFVSEYAIGLNGTSFARLVCDAPRQGVAALLASSAVAGNDAVVDSSDLDVTALPGKLQAGPSKLVVRTAAELAAAARLLLQLISESKLPSGSSAKAPPAAPTSRAGSAPSHPNV